MLHDAEVTGTQGENDHVISEFIAIQEVKAELDLAIEVLTYFNRDDLYKRHRTALSMRV